MAAYTDKSLVYLDETGCEEFYSPQYVYSKIGVKVDVEVPGRKFTRTNIVAGLLNGKIIGEMLYKTNMNSELFEPYFERIFLPAIPKGSVVIMDNATFHRKNKLKEIALKFNCTILFLPPYSPDLNPIEKKWANLKKWLRKNSKLFNSFFDAIMSYFKTN